jgi:hypothetical protein
MRVRGWRESCQLLVYCGFYVTLCGLYKVAIRGFVGSKVFIRWIAKSRLFLSVKSKLAGGYFVGFFYFLTLLIIEKLPHDIMTMIVFCSNHQDTDC